MLDGRRIAILVEQDFEDIELVEPMRAMREAGGKVTIIGAEVNVVYKGKRKGTKAKAEEAIANVRAKDFDAVIVPGGYAPDKMRLNPAMVDFIKKANELNKIIAAICHGPQLLISADIVRGRRVTSWPSIAIDLKNAGAIWLDEPVVIDNNIITSRKPSDLPQFDKAITEALGYDMN
jgi:protease I